MVTAARTGALPREAAEAPPTLSEALVERDELAAVRAELEQVRSQLYGVLEGARVAFSAEDAVVRALAGAEQIDEVADSLLEALCEAFEFDAATFWMLDPDDGKLICIAHRQSPTPRGRFLEAEIRSLHLSLDEGVAGRVFLERKEFLSDEALLAAHPALETLLRDDGLRTVCAFPIISGGAPVGAIEMERREQLAPDHAIDSAVRIIGERVGAFIEHGQLRWRYFSLVEDLRRKPAKRSRHREVEKSAAEPSEEAAELEAAA
jgi:transcriptional regulator with GAF, ATPase, and Fis domain